jgi:aminocarboxymuconate-semialdehyde decarboxylase
VIVDAHAHIVPPGVEDAVRSGAWTGVIDLRDVDGREVFFVGGEARSPFPANLVSVERRISIMDSQGVDVQLVSSWVGSVVDDLPPEVAIPWAQAFNDALIDVSRASGDRLLALAQVPMQSSSAAVAELERVMADPHVVGVEIKTMIDGADLDDPLFEDFWAAAAKMRCLVLIHPDRALSGRLSDRHFMSNTVGNPAESTIAAVSLICGGVLERHPGLRICLVHGGGTLPYQIGRLDHAHRELHSKVGGLPELPSAYARRLYYDTVTHSPEMLRFLLEFVGADHVVLGSDYPFEMGESDPLGLLDSVQGLDPRDRMRIAGANVERLISQIARP